MDAWYHVLYLTPGTHFWFIWFRCVISLKFPRWFIKWFIDFGPVPTIFSLEIKEAYDYFGEKSSFVPSYLLISFVASQAITWIMAWEYTTIQQYETVDIKTLCRQTKVKWWKKFNNNLISKSKIDEWVNSNSKSTSQQNTSPLKKQEEEREASFLLEKQKIMAELASAISMEEFETTLLKARSLLDSDNADHSDVLSSESNPYLWNGDILISLNVLKKLDILSFSLVSMLWDHLLSSIADQRSHYLTLGFTVKTTRQRKQTNVRTPFNATRRTLEKL
ncbi:hypothetical protein CR513_22413, partial [Mucuna pruriens]